LPGLLIVARLQELAVASRFPLAHAHGASSIEDIKGMESPSNRRSG
jgi:hypothetical protein